MVDAARGLPLLTLARDRQVICRVREDLTPSQHGSANLAAAGGFGRGDPRALSASLETASVIPPSLSLELPGPAIEICSFSNSPGGSSRASPSSKIQTSHVYRLPGEHAAADAVPVHRLNALLPPTP